MAFRAQDIVNIIKVGVYPVTLQFFSQEILPVQRVYPYIEVVNVSPEGTRENVDITEESNTFEVRILFRYNGPLDTETQNLHDTEVVVLSLLEAAILADKKIILEDKKWNRGDIRNNPFDVHGVQSTLAVSIIEVKSTTGLGNIGGESTLSLGTLMDIPLLDKPTERETEINENIYNTARIRKTLSPITDIHSFLAEMEYTKTRIDQLRTLKRNRATISPITYKRPGVADEIFTGKLVEISNPAPFDNIETIIIQIERLS